MKVDDSIKLLLMAKAAPDSKPIKMQAHESISSGKYAYDGFRLNWMEVQAQLETEQDFDDLIHLLEIHKRAFSK